MRVACKDDGVLELISRLTNYGKRHTKPYKGGL